MVKNLSCLFKNSFLTRDDKIKSKDNFRIYYVSNEILDKKKENLSKFIKEFLVFLDFFITNKYKTESLYSVIEEENFKKLTNLDCSYEVIFIIKN